MAASRMAELDAMCRETVKLRRKIDALEAEISEAKSRLRSLVESEIPSLMQELDLEKVRLTSGFEVSLSLECHARWPRDEDTAHRAAEHLTQLGLGDVIKVQVEADFSRGHREDAVRLFRLCQEFDTASSEIRESVHPQTLNKVLREAVASGLPVNLDLFQAHIFTKAKITEVP